MQFLGQIGRRGGVVDEHRARRHRLQRSHIGQRHRAHIVVVAHAHEHELGTSSRLRGRGRGPATVLGHPGLRPGRRAVVHGDLVASRDQVARHRVAHDPQPNERTTSHFEPSLTARTMRAARTARTVRTASAVPGVGLEPTSPLGQPVLSGPRQPVAPPGHAVNLPRRTSPADEPSQPEPQRSHPYEQAAQASACSITRLFSRASAASARSRVTAHPHSPLSSPVVLNPGNRPRPGSLRLGRSARSTRACARHRSAPRCDRRGRGISRRR